MRTVAIESPYAGDVARNVRYAKACVRDCLRRGEAPYASHLFFTQEGLLDDNVPKERKLGIAAGFAIAEKCDARVVYDDLGQSGWDDTRGPARSDDWPGCRVPDAGPWLGQAVTAVARRTMPAQKPGSSKQDYATPGEFLDAVTARFGSLQFDLAATARNSIVPGSYFSPKDNSLEQDWRRLKQERLWLNPPFGDIEPWAKKCATTIGKKIFFLVPASVGSNWYKNWVHDVSSVYYLSPRLSFDGKNPYPKDILLAVYGVHVGRHECWRWDR